MSKLSSWVKKFISLTRKYIQSSLLVALFVFLLVNGCSWQSRFWSNLGWLQWMRDEAHSTSSDSTIDYFDRALHTDPANQRAYLGAGMAHAAALDEPNALAMWRRGNVQPALLNQLGSQMRDRGLLDIAFIYFRSAGQLDKATPGEGYFRAGKLCQGTLANVPVLSSTNQQYCRSYFANNSGNLLLDGQFEYDINWGWTGSFLFENQVRAAIDLDQTIGVPVPSLALTGLTAGHHAGVYQRVSLQPGTEVRFSGHFRAANAADLAAWLLYVEWRRDGQVQGTHFYTMESDVEWRYLEGVFTLPDNSEPWAQFYPVLLIGQGSVWADDVRVEIVSE